MKKQVSKGRTRIAAICTTAGVILGLPTIDFGRKDIVGILRMLSLLMLCIGAILLWKDYLKMRQEEQNHDGQY